MKCYDNYITHLNTNSFIIDENNKQFKSEGILIGSEGGFTEQEVLYAKEQGILIKGLGKRILRCETAPICAASIIMYLTGNL